MKILNLSIASLIAFFAFSQVNAQTPKEKRTKAFHAIDKNSDNEISLEELTAKFGKKKTKAGKLFDVPKLFAKKDADSNGSISLEEFVASKKRKNKKKNKKQE